MVKLLLVAMALLLGVAAGARETATAQPSHATLIVRVVSPPTFFDSTAECPFGSSTVALTSVEGTQLGEASLCLSDIRPTARGFVEVGTLTLELPGGSLVAAVRVAFAFIPDGARALQLASGTVVTGTGVYAGATGSIRGAGLITFGADGSVQPNLVYVIHIGFGADGQARPAGRLQPEQRQGIFT